jgi:hypothetical protein
MTDLEQSKYQASLFISRVSSHPLTAVPELRMEDQYLRSLRRGMGQIGQVDRQQQVVLS